MEAGCGSGRSRRAARALSVVTALVGVLFLASPDCAPTTTTEELDLWAVRFLDDAHGYVAGAVTDQYDRALKGRLFTTTDGGARWSELQLPDSLIPRAMAIVGQAETCYVVGTCRPSG